MFSREKETFTFYCLLQHSITFGVDLGVLILTFFMNWSNELNPPSTVMSHYFNKIPKSQNKLPSLSEKLWEEWKRGSQGENFYGWFCKRENFFDDGSVVDVIMTIWKKGKFGLSFFSLFFLSCIYVMEFFYKRRKVWKEPFVLLLYRHSKKF